MSTTLSEWSAKPEVIITRRFVMSCVDRVREKAVSEKPHKTCRAESDSLEVLTNVTFGGRKPLDLRSFVLLVGHHFPTLPAPFTREELNVVVFGDNAKS